ncbi:hypothetical protein TRFO_29328 [Tritrichomonas foetus]|uniref:Uncharacterized protein n=1 Tax=Tritrichomonas foetus TaxID=1144522 RepID=A0A1J4K1E1_9EUKA|nr:hypothetical protein TRFO_29328 [Tritrichomonas foetus]|eukprot:OHT03293.1 hypothetical protein TRFO_29328 [Tritrichomonas foetus]
MLWFPLTIAQVIFGFSIMNFIFKSSFEFVILAILGIPFGFASSTMIYYFLSTFLGISTVHVMIHIGILFALSFLFFKIQAIPKFTKPEKSTSLFLAFSFGLSLFISYPLLYTPPNTVNKSMKPFLLEELTLITSFVNGINSGFSNPFKVRHPFCYKCSCRSHWGTALHSSMFIKAFSSLRVSLFVPSFLLLFHFSFIFLIAMKRNGILKNDIYLISALVLFYFAGGFGFVRWFWRDHRRDMRLDFVYNLRDFRTHWYHPLLNYLLAIRPSLMSISLIIDLTFFLHEIFSSSPSSVSSNSSSSSHLLNGSASNFKKGSFLFVAAGMLYGFTIPYQIEVTFSFSVFLILYIFINFFLEIIGNIRDVIHGIKEYHKIKYLISFAIFAGIGFALVFIPHFFISLPKATSASFIQLKKYWYELTEKGTFYGNIVIWYENLGIFAFVSIILCWFEVFSVKDLKLLKFYIPSFSVFILANRIIFNDDSEQNIFAFYPCWMIFAVCVFVRTFVKFTKSIRNDETKGIIIAWGTFLFALSVVSAMIGYKRLRNTYTPALPLNSQEIHEFFLSNTPKNSITICSSDEECIPVLLAGRRVLKSPDFYMKKAGFVTHPNANEAFSELKLNPDNKTVIPKLKYYIHYHSLPFSVNVQQNSENWRKVVENGPYQVYERIEAHK